MSDHPGTADEPGAGGVTPPGMPRVLVLAGSTEASALARRLVARDDVEVTSSFAGRVRALARPPGEVRVGGFGGADGLARWLRNEHIAAVIDATHPFTARMPHHVVAACDAVGVPRLRVLRPEWMPVPGDHWQPVASLDEAAGALKAMGARRVFLTTGRQELAPFAELDDVWFLVRAIEAPEPMPLVHAKVVLDRGPFEVPAERELLARHGIDAVVTKNSGGSAAAAKLVAARELGVPVVMVQRPAPVEPAVATVDDALAWCDRVLGR